MLPDRLGGRPRVYYVLRGRPFEGRRCAFALVVCIGFIVRVGLLGIVGVGGATVGVGQGVPVDFAIGLKVLLLIKVHRNYYQVIDKLA